MMGSAMIISGSASSYERPKGRSTAARGTRPGRPASPIVANELMKENVPRSNSSRPPKVCPVKFPTNKAATMKCTILPNRTTANPIGMKSSHGSLGACSTSVIVSSAVGAQRSVFRVAAANASGAMNATKICFGLTRRAIDMQSIDNVTSRVLVTRKARTKGPSVLRASGPRSAILGAINAMMPMGIRRLNQSKIRMQAD